VRGECHKKNFLQGLAGPIIFYSRDGHAERAVVMTDCDVLIIVRSSANRLALLNGVTDGGESSVESDAQLQGAKLSCFRNHDGRKVGITVSAAADPRARMDKMVSLATKTGCTWMLLVGPGYTLQDMKVRRVQLPGECVPYIVTDVDSLMELLGFRDIEAIRREVLAPLFVAEPSVPITPSAVERSLTPITPALPRPPSSSGAIRPRPEVHAASRRTVDPDEEVGVHMGSEQDVNDDARFDIDDDGTVSVSRGNVSVHMTGVSMDGDTFRALMGLVAADPAPGPPQVVDMPASPEEVQALSRGRGRGRSNGPQRRGRTGPSIMNGRPDFQPRIQRAVPTAATVSPAPSVATGARHYVALDAMGRLPQPPARSDSPPVVSRRSDPFPAGFSPWDGGYHFTPTGLDNMDWGDDDEDNIENPIEYPTPTDDRPPWLQTMVGRYDAMVGRQYDALDPETGFVPPSQRQSQRSAAVDSVGDLISSQIGGSALGFQDSLAAARRVDQAAGGIPIAPPPSRAPLHPMTTHERMRRSRQREAERSQQRDLGRVAVIGERTKKVLARKREEPEEIEAMCTTAEDNTCMVCETRHITTVMIPCGHMYYCNECSNQWVDAHHNCPVCKEAVVAVLQCRTKFDVIDEHKRRKLVPEDEPEEGEHAQEAKERNAVAKKRNEAARSRRKEVAASLVKEASQLDLETPPPFAAPALSSRTPQ
jgi:hypothetical protein